MLANDAPLGLDVVSNRGNGGRRMAAPVVRRCRWCKSVARAPLRDVRESRARRAPMVLVLVLIRCGVKPGSAGGDMVRLAGRGSTLTSKGHVHIARTGLARSLARRDSGVKRVHRPRRSARILRPPRLLYGRRRTDRLDYATDQTRFLPRCSGLRSSAPDTRSSCAYKTSQRWPAGFVGPLRSAVHLSYPRAHLYRTLLFTVLTSLSPHPNPQLSMSDIEKASTSNAARKSRLGDPTPLGMYGLSATLLVLSLYNDHARHISVPNVIVGMGLFYGGLAQFLAGMWCFAAGSTLGATVFATYGGFFMSYATLLIPNSGVLAAYSSDPNMFADAVGISFMAFMIVSIFFVMASLRHSIAFTALFVAVVLTFVFLGAAEFTRKSGLLKAGGAFGITGAMIGFYCGTSPLLGPDGIVPLPLGMISPRRS